MSDCIKISNVHVDFRGVSALQGVNLQVPTGSVFALLGENGAGKTTLIRVLTGYQEPNLGYCEVLGIDPERHALEIRRRVGYVSDSPALYEWMRIDEIGWFTASFYPKGFIERYKASIERYQLPLEKKLKYLSKGQRAKVALSLAMAHDPELLILDEPTSGLDPLVRREFMESMVDRATAGKTVLLSSHHISEVERVADHVCIIHQGKVKLVGDLETLQKTVLEVSLLFKDPTCPSPMIPVPSEILSMERDGSQARWIVKSDSLQLQKSLESWPGVQQVRIRPASLEEVFVACTRGDRKSPDHSSEKGTEQVGNWNAALHAFRSNQQVS